MPSPFDAALDRITDGLDRLTGDDRALFFAFWAERMFPLYAEFVARERWGDEGALRRILDDTWEGLAGNALARTRLKKTLERLDELTPHGDDFASLETTFAQNACSCLGSAVRQTLGELVPSTEIASVVESVRTGLIHAATGLVDVGEDDEAIALEAELARRPRVQAVVDELLAIVGIVEAGAADRDGLVQRLRTAAKEQPWSAAVLASLG